MNIRSFFVASALLATAASSAIAAPTYRRAPQANPALNRFSVPTPPASLKVSARPRIVLQTTKGPITLELYKQSAPLQVRSFVYLTKRGFYNGIRFHRRANLLESTGGIGFIIQGGDPSTKVPALSQFAGQGGPGYETPLEISKLKHDKFALAAARTSDPDSAGSQFYICQDPVHFLDKGYTVFGRVVGGQRAALALREGDTIKSARVVK